MAVAELTVLKPKPMSDFVETEQVKNITKRALSYLEVGFPVHFRGASGVGKTTLALHVASLYGQPVVLLHGDEARSTADLVGGAQGYHYRRVVDRFISRVLKVEEEMNSRWLDSRVTTACKNGFTLVYDEFTRSRPEANNVLLSILQEKIFDLPLAAGGNEYLRVHPNFRAIFTSNPDEYAGVYRSQDALRDRLITIDLDFYDEETEVAIIAAKSGLVLKDARKIASIIRDLRNSEKCECYPTIRGGIMVGRTIKSIGVEARSRDPRFREICIDVLSSETSRTGNRKEITCARELVDTLIAKHCSE